MISFAATLLALKFAESTRGIEFEGWEDVLGTAIICWIVSWLSAMGLGALHTSDDLESFGSALALSLASEFGATIVALLLAWAFVSGTRVRTLFGLIVAAVLVAVFTYGAQMLVAGTAMHWL